MINKTGIAARIGLATACLVALLAAPAGASLPAGGRLVASIATPTPRSVITGYRLRLGHHRADADRHSPRPAHQRGHRPHPHARSRIGDGGRRGRDLGDELPRQQPHPDRPVAQPRDPGRSASPPGAPARSASRSSAASSGSRTTTASRPPRSPRSTPPRCAWSTSSPSAPTTSPGRSGSSPAPARSGPTSTASRTWSSASTRAPTASWPRSPPRARAPNSRRTSTGVWGAGGDDGSCPPGISRIDPRTNSVTATFDEGGAPDAVALDDGSLWYGTTTTHKLGRIDTRTNTVVSLLNLPGPAFNMTAGARAIWATDPDDGLLFKVLPARASRRAIPTPGGAR